MEEKKEIVAVSGVISQEIFKKFLGYHIQSLNKMVLTVLLMGFFLYIWLILDLGWFFSLITTLILWGTIKLMLSMVMNFRSVKEYKSDKLMQNEVFLTISEDGIQQKRRNAEAFWEWDDILSIQEQKDMFLFYVSKNKAVLLPKSFMVNHEMIKLRKIIHNNALTQNVRLLKEPE
ncbi:YcxB family protein [Bacillus sp. RO2]|uniref:YcxB family protein n=1 Tax=Bacillus sp. RO2 TaxID=2723913 RepID=UPI00145C5972|nr:YcxB family protein [Bacillus sp. RO2]NMH72145.1 YcxB family protein [Bacillus sp. RO2]